tara:strand:+ start:911 stop:1684 length:774 start_codon:yes stop_codon:yes gene_type:complete
VTKLQIKELLAQHHPHLSSTLSDMYLEQAANTICYKTDASKRSIVMNSIAGQRWYNFPMEAIKIEAVYFNDVKIPRLIGDPIIDDDEFDNNAKDNTGTALGTPTANVENKRFWIYSPYKKHHEGSTTEQKEAERIQARIGIVEKVNNSVTRDGRTSDYQSCSITGTTNIRVLGSFIPKPFASDDDATKDYVGPLSSIPAEFHEVILNGAIARGYKDPTNFKSDMYQFFNNEFEMGIKEIKKSTRTRTGTGFIRPQTF